MNNLDYYGSDFTEQEYDDRALASISDKILAKEAELCDQSWFDYRFMHPTQRTYLFAHYYSKAYQRIYERYFDHHGTKRTGMGQGDPLKPLTDKGKKNPMVTMLWKARQMADSLRMPYDEFVNIGIEQSLSVRGKVFNGYRIKITPSFLYSEQVLELIVTKWLERNEARIYSASNDFYLRVNYKEHPYQNEYQAYLVEKISSRTSPEYSLKLFGLTKHSQLTSDTIKQNFNDEVIRKAMKLAI